MLGTKRLPLKVPSFDIYIYHLYLMTSANDEFHDVIQIDDVIILTERIKFHNVDINRWRVIFSSFSTSLFRLQTLHSEIISTCWFFITEACDSIVWLPGNKPL